MPNAATCPKALCGRAVTPTVRAGHINRRGIKLAVYPPADLPTHTLRPERRASCGFCKKRDALHVTPRIAIKYQMLLSFGYGRPVTTAFGRNRPPFLFFVASKRSSPSRSPSFWGAAIGTARWYNTAVFVRVIPGRSPVGRSRAFRDRPTMQARDSKILRKQTASLLFFLHPTGLRAGHVFL